jgi:hypothetical protein
LEKRFVYFSQLIFKPVDKTTFSDFTVYGTLAESNIRNAQFPQILSNGKAILE